MSERSIRRYLTGIWERLREGGRGQSYLYRAIVLYTLADLAIAVGRPLPPNQPEPRPTSYESTNTAHHDGAPGNPASVFENSKSNIPADANIASKRNQPSTKKEDSEWLEKLFNDLKITDILLALFTLLLVFYTKRLWTSTSDLVRGGEQTAEKQLRAYLSAEPKILIELQAGYPCSALVIIKNNGQTPANNFRWVATCERVSQMEIDRPGSLIEPKPGQSLPTQVLHPHFESQCTAVSISPLTDKDIKEIEDSIGDKLYVFGKIMYVDVFGIDRVTNFCAQLEGDALKQARIAHAKRAWQQIQQPNPIKIGPAKIEWDGMWSFTTLHNEAS